jgi:hypothetical protein
MRENLVSERGRPSAFTAELAQEICRRLAEGQTLRAVCRDEAMPQESTVRRWALEDREGFLAQYATAREIGYQSMADETLEIADDSSQDEVTDGEGNVRFNSEFAARSRLRVDTRKWLLSKALPKIYGDKIIQEHTGRVTLSHEEALGELE